MGNTEQMGIFFFFTTIVKVLLSSICDEDHFQCFDFVVHVMSIVNCVEIISTASCVKMAYHETYFLTTGLISPTVGQEFRVLFKVGSSL